MKRLFPSNPKRKQPEEEEKTMDVPDPPDVSNNPDGEMNLEENIENVCKKLQEIASQLNIGTCPDLSPKKLCFQHIESQLKDFQQEFKMARELKIDFFWPQWTPPDVKIRFIAQIGSLDIHHPKTIVRYIQTLEELNSNTDNHLLYNAQQLFCSKHFTPLAPKQVHTMVTGNLLMCCLLEPKKHLKATECELLTPEVWKIRVNNVLNYQRQNFAIWRQVDALAVQRQNNSTEIPKIHPEIYWNEIPEAKELEIHQRLLEFYLNLAADNNLRKTEHGIWQEHIDSKDGQLIKTKWFKLTYESFRAWIEEEANGNMELQRALDKNRISNITFLENRLKEIQDPRLPTLKVNRSLFSFLNGIFDGDTGKFYLFTENDEHGDSTEDLHTRDTCANFFRTTIPIQWFQPNFDLDNIDTPSWNRIFLDQKWDMDTIHCMEFFLGRGVRILDGGQKCLFIVGAAGAGKSLILRAFAKIYPSIYIGYIMDDAQKDFTDEHLRDKFIVMGLDITKDIQISSARFNSWVTGEEITINRKHLEAISILWDKPLYFASNENPGFKTKAGSGGRRVAIFSCPYAILNADTTLDTKLQEELGKYLIKTRLRYLQKLKAYGTQNIWKKMVDGKPLLPKMVVDNEKKYLAENSLPDAFLDHYTEIKKIEFDVNYVCLKDQFKQLYDSFRQEQKQIYKTKYPEACTASNFNYALAQRNCFWDEEKNEIRGLRFSKNNGTEQKQTTHTVLLNTKHKM